MASRTSLSINLPDTLYDKLKEEAEATGLGLQDVIVTALDSYFKPASAEQQPTRQASRQASLRTAASSASEEGGAWGLRSQQPSRAASVPLERQASALPVLYVSDPIIMLIDGLLQGERSVSHALRHGSFGLGTLSQLDGEVVVLDGIAYQQGPAGSTRQLTGGEITPFMTVTQFNKARARHFPLQPVADYEELQEQLKGKFRSGNLIYAVYIEGAFSYLQSRAVCKQEGHVRLKEAAKHQTVSEQRDVEGCLVGFWFPPFAGATINVPGFHFHFLTAARDRGGHVLQLKMERGKAWVNEIHRAQVDLPFSEEYLESELDVAGLAEGDLKVAESEVAKASLNEG